MPLPSNPSSCRPVSAALPGRRNSPQCIGTRAENVSKDRALDHVAAYGCFNDISASEIIKADGHFDRGKNFATFGPFGPFLASADEIPDPHALRGDLKVDGRTMQVGLNA